VRYLTDFADQAVILPLVLATAVALALQGWRRGALVWVIVVLGTFAAMLGLKLMCLACSPLFGPMDVHSPSGHVAAATVVAGGLAAMISRRRAAILPAALLAAAAIGITRVVLGAHSFSEVVLGAMVGLSGAAALARFAGAPPRLRIAPLVGVIVVVATWFHGLHMPAEAAIRHTAMYAARYIPACRGTPQWERSTLGPDRSLHPVLTANWRQVLWRPVQQPFPKLH
jgi:membrane-associated phospholipid phosphatase